jgi:DNA polymerase delta subunit 2
MKPRVQEHMKAVWPETKVVPRVIDLAVGNVQWAFAGTVYKDMKLKPCVLDEFTNEAILQGLPEEKDNYVAEDDSLVLEDETGRVSLVVSESCSSKVSELVSGIVIGVRGHVTESGEVMVVDLCYPGMPRLQDPRPDMAERTPHVLLVSGFNIGNNDDIGKLKLKLLTDCITGQLGSPLEQDTVWRHVTRVIVAGNSLASLADKDGRDTLSRDEQDTLAAPLKEADAMFGQIARSVPIDVMPGASDPSNVNMPQQPLHPCLLPFSNCFKNHFSCVTNPYRADVEGVEILGHSGQPVKDIKKFTSLESEIEVLERTLKWQHLAPTAPDTLACYPFYKRDPFVMSAKCPHVMFTGNASKFETRTVDGPNGQSVRLIAVPEFSKSGSAVLMNLQSLEVKEVSFQLQNIGGSEPTAHNQQA